MVVVLGLLIVTAVLTLSAVVVLFALASEAEVLPSLTRGASSGSDQPAASPRERAAAQVFPPRSARGSR